MIVFFYIMVVAVAAAAAAAAAVCVFLKIKFIYAMCVCACVLSIPSKTWAVQYRRSLKLFLICHALLMNIFGLVSFFFFK